jgi:hypothetical protein
VASSYDAEQRRLVIDLHETAAAKSIIVQATSVQEGGNSKARIP